jgi:hypothetical protein
VDGSHAKKECIIRFFDLWDVSRERKEDEMETLVYAWSKIKNKSKMADWLNKNDNMAGPKLIKDFPSASGLSSSLLIAVGDPNTGTLYKTTLADLNIGTQSFAGFQGAIGPTGAGGGAQGPIGSTGIQGFQGFE